jgi:hypothetical protein
VSDQNDFAALQSVLKFDLDGLSDLETLCGRAGLRLVSPDQPREHLLEADSHLGALPAPALVRHPGPHPVRDGLFRDITELGELRGS